MRELIDEIVKLDAFVNDGKVRGPVLRFPTARGKKDESEIYVDTVSGKCVVESWWYVSGHNGDAYGCSTEELNSTAVLLELDCVRRGLMAAAKCKVRKDEAMLAYQQEDDRLGAVIDRLVLGK